MRASAALLLLTPLLLAASGQVQPVRDPLDAQLREARAEQAAAERSAAALEQAADNAKSEATRLQARQAAAAQAIDAAEARITTADTQLRLVAASLAERRQRLAAEQHPLASLLAGLATFGHQPPLLAIADNASVDQLVEVRALFDSTMPVIRARTAALSAELRDNDGLMRSLQASRTEAINSRQALVDQRQRFAALQAQAIRSSEHSASQALSAGDLGLAAGETVQQLQGDAAASRNAAALASALAALGPAPPRPAASDSQSPLPPFAYRLPAAAPVVTGLGAVSANGVRSRGLTLATPRGAPVLAPAAGTVRFSGPFRDYDGVLIIEHGNGWMSLLVNISSQLKAGDRVSLGQSLGRALGPLGVELSQNGRRVSAALIAGSSQTLSNGGKGG